ncbi:MAG: hypothetical protein AB7E72_03270 [Lysobacterales bacterium]
MNKAAQDTVVTQETLALSDAIKASPPAESRVAVAHADPDESHEHRLGVGLGAALGGTAGVAAGIVVSTSKGLAAGLALGGPIGGAVGLVAGAVAGGLLGSAVGEAFNPSAEERHWSEAFATEPYVMGGYTLDDYRPAYRLGYEAYGQHPGKTFEDVESRLQDEYADLRGKSRLGWEDARHAARAAWQRRARAQTD